MGTIPSSAQTEIPLPDDLVRPIDLRTEGHRVLVTLTTPGVDDAAQIRLSPQSALLLAMDLMRCAKAADRA